MGEKRIRRAFTKCIMDRLQDRYKDVNDTKVNQLFKKIEDCLGELENLKKTSGGLTKGKIKKLEGFTREQLEQYLMKLKKQAEEQQ